MKSYTFTELWLKSRDERLTLVLWNVGDGGEVGLAAVTVTILAVLLALPDWENTDLPCCNGVSFLDINCWKEMQTQKCIKLPCNSDILWKQKCYYELRQYIISWKIVLTPTWALKLLTRFARLFWSLASIRVVCEGGTVDSGVLFSNGKMPKVGVSGLMELLNILR